MFGHIWPHLGQVYGRALAILGRQGPCRPHIINTDLGLEWVHLGYTSGKPRLRLGLLFSGFQNSVVVHRVMYFGFQNSDYICERMRA